MKQVLLHWIITGEQIFDESPAGDILKEVWLLNDKTIHCRLYCVDGVTRHYTLSIADFEVRFKINLANYLPANVL